MQMIVCDANLPFLPKPLAQIISQEHTLTSKLTHAIARLILALTAIEKFQKFSVQALLS